MITLRFAMPEEAEDSCNSCKSKQSTHVLEICKTANGNSRCWCFCDACIKRLAHQTHTATHLMQEKEAQGGQD